MSHLFENNRALLFWMTVAILIVSSVITLGFDNVYSDGISIPINVFASVGLFLMMMTHVIEELESICNP
ncbi:hypothetical protein [Acinetobacter soli]|uniref:hypothetical protein n=1 Tax=Acinetobacter soli TaxID=487316 RepID=UPI001BAA4472|nr:hypothetical protein [Acinetobacter soli]